MQSITESDWKVFRQLHAIALERFCGRIVDEIQTITSDSNRSTHNRYLDVLALIQTRKREMAVAFDDLRRSTAFLQLRVIRSHGLVNEEEIERFSPELRERLRLALD